MLLSHVVELATSSSHQNFDQKINKQVIDDFLKNLDLDSKSNKLDSTPEPYRCAGLNSPTNTTKQILTRKDHTPKPRK